MTWLTHSVFAYFSASVLGINPFIASLGSTAPDWFEDFLGVNEHRGITHYLVFWFGSLIISFIFYLLYPGNFLTSAVFSFVYGGFTHILLDSLTVSGVPLGFGNVRVRIGGIIKTSSLSEYVFLAVVIFAFMPFVFTGSSIGFNSYKGLYEKGIIDKKEYEELKFKFF